MKLLFTFFILFLSFAIIAQDFHTVFEYSDATNKGITIHNSYPKGGQRYTDFKTGKEYAYVIFWTCITNESESNLTLDIQFSNDLSTLPFEPKTIFSLYLPDEKMSFEKEPLFDYGLDIKSFLDEKIDQPTQLRKSIPSGESYLFYSVAISKPVSGGVRAGFELEGREVIYKINDYQVRCGSITKE